jgi:hypothetical protein
MIKYLIYIVITKSTFAIRCNVKLPLKEAYYGSKDKNHL